MKNWKREAVVVTLAAAAILMVTMGTRQSLGLFVSPLNTTTGLGVAAISLALAVGQFTWGLAQPIAGAIADRYGTGRVIVGGLFLLAIGSALTPFMTSSLGLIVSLGLLSGHRLGARQLLGADRRRRDEAQPRRTRQGRRNHQCRRLVRPVRVRPHRAEADLGVRLDGRDVDARRADARRVAAGGIGLAQGSAEAASVGPGHVARGEERHVRSELPAAARGLLHVRLPHRLPRDAPAAGGEPLRPAAHGGELVARHHRHQQHRRQPLRGLRHGALSQQVHPRVDVRLARGPDRDLPRGAEDRLTFYSSRSGLGFTWLATVPPTAAIVGKLFGVRYLATLFGLTLLSHQIGGFLGAYLGGLAYENSGNYTGCGMPTWRSPPRLAVVNLPIREAPIVAAVPKPA
jgi:hypothetical protein